MHVKMLVRYLAVRESPVRPADVVMALGSSDLDVPREAARFFHEGLAPRIAVCGGIGRLTGALGKPEALAYAEVLRELKVPEEVITIEHQSTNSGENIAYGMRLLQGHGINVRSVLLVQTPLLQRRAELTFMRQFPSVEVRSWAASIPEVTPENEDQLRELAVGEIDRLLTYGPAGKDFIVDPKLPVDVLQAYKELVGDELKASNL